MVYSFVEAVEFAAAHVSPFFVLSSFKIGIMLSVDAIQLVVRVILLSLSSMTSLEYGAFMISKYNV